MSKIRRDAIIGLFLCAIIIAIVVNIPSIVTLIIGAVAIAAAVYFIYMFYKY